MSADSLKTCEQGRKDRRHIKADRKVEVRQETETPWSLRLGQVRRSLWRWLPGALSWCRLMRQLAAKLRQIELFLRRRQLPRQFSPFTGIVGRPAAECGRRRL